MSDNNRWLVFFESEPSFGMLPPSPFPLGYAPIALIQVEALEDAFALCQNTEDNVPWTAKPHVIDQVEGVPLQQRSLSVNDVLVHLASGRSFLCSMAGWVELPVMLHLYESKERGKKVVH